MLSQVRKFGLHLILANQSIAQLPSGLQVALGNAQTIVAFRVSRADAEALARVLGEADPQAVKHQAQSPSQHPLFSPMHEQWEAFVKHLTRQDVRQATIKTADDRLAVIWAERMRDPNCKPEEIEELIQSSLSQHGVPYQTHAMKQTLPPSSMEPVPSLFSY
jgi:hypothetical protein